MAEQPLPESQHERWIKYGLNVALSTLVVFVLAVALIYLAQTRKKRFDTSSQSINSLKDQTKNILKDLKSPITIVSLYSRNDTSAAANDPQWADHVAQVEDLLDEYKRNSSKVETEIIDPVTYPTKVDDLIHKVTDKYGGEVKKYKDFLDTYPAQYKQISDFATAEAAKVADLPFNEIKTQDLANTLLITVSTVQGFPKVLDQGKIKIDRQLKQKPPDYKGATDSINDTMSSLSEMLGRIIADFKTDKDNEQVPEGIRKYMNDSLAGYVKTKDTADAIVTQIGKLGELKLDSLRQSLREKNAILVMSDTDLKVIAADKVWQKEVDRRAAPGAEPIKAKFAGEQQLSTAILSLTAKSKPKVCFMRPGGPPITERNPFARNSGSFADVADRLRDYNFTVMEKDFTGMYAMQAQMQGEQVAPEPSDDEVKDAVWIVFDLPTQPPQQGMPPPTIAAKLAEHFANGGSAMVLAYPSADDLAVPLGPWGVELKTNLLAVKPAVTGTNDREGNMIENAQRLQYVFILNQYGDHPLAKPLASLDAAMVPIVPITFTKKDGYTGQGIIPLPTSPLTWGTSSATDALDGKEVKFDSTKGDLAGPIFAGAAVEKKDGSRLVALGSLTFATDQLIEIPDEDLMKQGYRVPRFPGNAELFANSIYWLTHMEPMIAISPAAMQISRIAPMSDGAAKAWNIGVLLVGLPGLVIVAGVLMYLVRRD